MNAKYITVGIVIALIVIAGAVGYYAGYYLPHGKTAGTSTSSSSGGAAGTSAVSVESYSVFLTDPPSVPQGTQAVYLNISAVAIHLTNGSWIYSSSSEAINILKLVNVSQVIAVFRIPKNSTVTQVRLFISNASIEINGKLYQLFIPSGVVKIPLTNATASPGSLVDLQAHVVEAYVGGQPTYVLTPVVSAVPFNESAPLGSSVSVPRHFLGLLNESRADLVIDSAVIRTSGNQTFMNITITNEGSEPVTIYGVAVNGTWNISGSLNLSDTPAGQVRASLSAQAAMPLFFAVNGTQLVEFPAVFKQFGLHEVESESDDPQLSNFSAMSWNFSMPFHEDDGRLVLGYSGYTLEPGQTASFVFSGAITLPHASLDDAHHEMRMQIYIAPMAGGSYLFRIFSVPLSNATYMATAS